MAELAALRSKWEKDGNIIWESDGNIHGDVLVILQYEDGGNYDCMRYTSKGYWDRGEGRFKNGGGEWRAHQSIWTAHQDLKNVPATEVFSWIFRNP